MQACVVERKVVDPSSSAALLSDFSVGLRTVPINQTLQTLQNTMLYFQVTRSWHNLRKYKCC